MHATKGHGMSLSQISIRILGQFYDVHGILLNFDKKSIKNVFKAVIKAEC